MENWQGGNYRQMMMMIMVMRAYLQREAFFADRVITHQGKKLHNEVPVNNGPHIRRWSHNIIILTAVLQCLQYSVQ